MSKLYLGIDIGGTNVKIGIFEHDMNIIAKASVPTRADMGPEFVVERICDTVKDILKDSGHSLDDLQAVGIGTPGPADYKAGIVINSTNMQKFNNTPLRDMVSRGLNNKPTVLENDANVACWGEFATGAGADSNDMIFFTLGTGIGGGIVTNGELVQGVDGNGAELGHIIIHPNGRKCNCGQKGCAESHASAFWTGKIAEEAVAAGAESSLKAVYAETGRVTCKDVFNHCKAGDKLASKVVDDTCQTLAILCINMLHTTEPTKFVFAGGMIAAGDILLERIRYFFDKHIWTLKKETVEICFATLGEDAGIIGAAALAKHKFA